MASPTKRNADHLSGDQAPTSDDVKHPMTTSNSRHHTADSASKTPEKIRSKVSAQRKIRVQELFMDVTNIDHYKVVDVDEAESEGKKLYSDQHHLNMFQNTGHGPLSEAEKKLRSSRLSTWRKANDNLGDDINSGKSVSRAHEEDWSVIDYVKCTSGTCHHFGTDPS